MERNSFRQIIAIGGGGFGRKPHYSLTIEKYILAQSQKKSPNICFVPTASAEDPNYIVNFYTAFSRLSCNPTHLSLFKRTPNLKSFINKHDIFYIGGGNTKSMLAVWKEWKLDQLLLKAYQKGAILCGVSAGAICWFQQGITDSWASQLNLMECLGMLPGCCCPHYDTESQRSTHVKTLLEKNIIDSCYSIEDGVALHFKQETLHSAIQFEKNKNAYLVENKNQTINKNTIEKISL